MVTWTIEAVYRNGVFRPLSPVALPEDACVTLVLSSEGVPGASRMPAFGQMDESEIAWVGWAGSGVPANLADLVHDEG